MCQENVLQLCSITQTVTFQWHFLKGTSSMVVSGSPNRCQVAYKPPIGIIYHLYTTYILPSGWLYATYHLLGEPETTIDKLLCTLLSNSYVAEWLKGLPALHIHHETIQKLWWYYFFRHIPNPSSQDVRWIVGKNHDGYFDSSQTHDQKTSLAAWMGKKKPSFLKNTSTWKGIWCSKLRMRMIDHFEFWPSHPFNWVRSVDNHWVVLTLRYQATHVSPTRPRCSVVTSMLRFPSVPTGPTKGGYDWYPSIKLGWSFYYEPKQCTIEKKSRKIINYKSHTFAIFDPDLSNVGGVFSWSLKFCCTSMAFSSKKWSQWSFTGAGR